MRLKVKRILEAKLSDILEGFFLDIPFTLALTLLNFIIHDFFWDNQKFTKFVLCIF